MLKRWTRSSVCRVIGGHRSRRPRENALLVVAVHNHVFLDGRLPGRSVFHAVLRDVRHLHLPNFPRRKPAEWGCPLMVMAPLDAGRSPGENAHELGLAVSLDSGNPQDLSRADVEGDVGKRAHAFVIRVATDPGRSRRGCPWTGGGAILSKLISRPTMR